MQFLQPKNVRLSQLFSPFSYSYTFHWISGLWGYGSGLLVLQILISFIRCLWIFKKFELGNYHMMMVIKARWSTFSLMVFRNYDLKEKWVISLFLNPDTRIHDTFFNLNGFLLYCYYRCSVLLVMMISACPHKLIKRREEIAFILDMVSDL